MYNKINKYFLDITKDLEVGGEYAVGILNLDNAINKLNFMVNGVDGKIDIQLFEDAHFQNGTEIKLYDMNRINDNSSSLKIYDHCYVDDTGDKIRDSHAGQFIFSGMVERDNFITLKNNTMYILKITNLSSTDNTIDLNLNVEEKI